MNKIFSDDVQKLDTLTLPTHTNLKLSENCRPALKNLGGDSKNPLVSRMSFDSLLGSVGHLYFVLFNFGLLL